MTMSWRARMASRRSVGGAMDMVRSEYHGSRRSRPGPAAGVSPLPERASSSLEQRADLRRVECRAASPSPARWRSAPSRATGSRADQRHRLERPAADLAADGGGAAAASRRSRRRACRARSDGALKGSKRFATMRFSRSTAKRNCIRSFEPTETKSAARQISSIWNSSEGTSSMTPSLSSLGSA